MTAPHKADPDYQKKHYHMRKANGKASEYMCDHCDGDAQQWAQIHGKDGWDPEEDYMPLCRSCHSKYDYTEERKRKIGASNRGKKRTPEQLKALSEAHMGKPSPMRKLSMDQAQEIRAIHKQGGKTYKQIADLYGVSEPTVGCIIRGVIYVSG